MKCDFGKHLKQIQLLKYVHDKFLESKGASSGYLFCLTDSPKPQKESVYNFKKDKTCDNSHLRSWSHLISGIFASK